MYVGIGQICICVLEYTRVPVVKYLLSCLIPGWYVFPVTIAYSDK